MMCPSSGPLLQRVVRASLTASKSCLSARANCFRKRNPDRGSLFHRGFQPPVFAPPQFSMARNCRASLRSWRVFGLMVSSATRRCARMNSVFCLPDAPFHRNPCRSADIVGKASEEAVDGPSHRPLCPTCRELRSNSLLPQIPQLSCSIRSPNSSSVSCHRYSHSTTILAQAYLDGTSTSVKLPGVAASTAPTTLSNVAAQSGPLLIADHDKGAQPCPLTDNVDKV